MLVGLLRYSVCCIPVLLFFASRTLLLVHRFVIFARFSWHPLFICCPTWFASKYTVGPSRVCKASLVLMRNLVASVIAQVGRRIVSVLAFKMFTRFGWSMAPLFC